jgi:predicted Fe-Mo cluster-binding NifX family protein
MRIAVVSTDKVRVNGRFGQAERFLIYEEKSSGLTLVDERPSEPMLDDYFDCDMLDWVADIIKDCDRVYMARICDEPAYALQQRGIKPVVYEGPIREIALRRKQQ